MKNKGFTLIEIIVCIALLSTISSIVIVNKKNSDNLKDINKKVSNDVDIYLNTKKDEDGDTYIEGINKGGQGLYINLKTLIDEGLIDKEIVNTLEKKENKKSEDLKILATKSISNTNTKECLGQIEYTFSWDKVSTPIYLCPKNTNEVKCDESNTNDFSELLLSKNKLYELNEINNNNYYYYSSYTATLSSKFSQSKENGIIKLKNVDKYYYRGNVENNYVIFINQHNKWYDTETKKYDYTKFNDSYIFRIVYFNDKEMKVLQEATYGTSSFTCNNTKDFVNKTLNDNMLAATSQLRTLFTDDYYQHKTIKSLSSVKDETYYKNQTLCTDDISSYSFGHFHDNNYKEKNCTGETTTKKVVPLTIYESLIAGTFKDLSTNNNGNRFRCSKFIKSDCDGGPTTNLNYISEGNGTLLWPMLNKSNTNYFLYLSGLNDNYTSEEKNNEASRGNYGYINPISYPTINPCYNIRPTLLLNMKNLYIKSGSGLKMDPYVIDIKNNT